ncbi:MAG: TrkA family potassium uptake protein [bacterium]
MSRQILVIGLGQFGSSLARALAHHGNEVLVADTDASKVAELAPHVADAVVIDATDEVALARLGPAQRDVCVCAIGGDSREGSIIVTALLRQLGARRVIGRATDALHARILALVGAHEVVNPELDFGERLAIRLAWRHVINVLPLGGDLVLTEIVAPQSFWGRTLAELDLRRRVGVTVAAVRREGPTGVAVSIPDPHQPLLRGDALMLVSAEGAARALTEGT